MLRTKLLVGGIFILLFMVMGLSFAVFQGSNNSVLLYPNLKTLPPSNLRFDRTDVSIEQSGKMKNVLRFTNTVWNSGEGELHLRSFIDPKVSTHSAYQRVFDKKKNKNLEIKSGVFEFHQAHGHFHFNDWSYFELWSKDQFEKWEGSGRNEEEKKLIKTMEKTSACAWDENFIKSLPNSPKGKSYLEDKCRPMEDNIMVQGISVGWGDTYESYRFEQWVELGDEILPDGEYVLRSIADPLNLISESENKSDEGRESGRDNEGVTFFKVQSGVISELQI